MVWRIAILTVAFALISLKPLANYNGYCTDGLEFWKWTRATDQEVINYLTANAIHTDGGQPTVYSIPAANEITGYNHLPPTIAQRLLGKKNILILGVRPHQFATLTKGRELFYTPNCLDGYVPAQ